MKKLNVVPHQQREGLMLTESRVGDQEMLDRQERAETLAAIRQGLAEAERNVGLPLHEAAARLRSKHGFSRGETHRSHTKR